MEAQPQRLYRNTQKSVLAGVCAGLADYFKVDVVWVRLIFVLSIFFGLAKIGFMGPIIYIVLWIVLPIKPYVLFPKKTEEASTESSFTELDESERENDMPLQTNQETRRPTLGIILLGIGVLLLLIQLDYFHWQELRKYWPLMLIGLGISIIITSFNKRKKDDSEIAESHLNENEDEV